jgi:hypothetical protein
VTRSYEEFLASKALVIEPSGVCHDVPLNGKLFDFQRDVVKWALRLGRAALWEDCGLGKSIQEIEWARVVSEHTGKPVLILTPLAVAAQFVTEGAKFGVTVTHARDDCDIASGVNVTNYERLHRFDVSRFGGVVLDESSILKNFAGKTRNDLVDKFASTPFRLACTATPAPNDTIEIANHAEFLGIMPRREMMSRFFVNDGETTQAWRLKGHAEKEFWRWVAGWAVTVRKPSDLGYENGGFDLPPLNMHEHVVAADDETARRRGLLFNMSADTLLEQRQARRATLDQRVGLAAKMVNDSDEPWIIWCDLNDESAALAKAIPDAVEVRGSDSPETKERRLAMFTNGEARVIVSKPSVAGWGLNWWHCARVAYVGVSHSFEALYQSVRRAWRFGQTRPVECHIIVSDLDGAVVANLKRKMRDAERMGDAMVHAMSETNRENLRGTRRDFDSYNATKIVEVPSWLSSTQ